MQSEKIKNYLYFSIILGIIIFALSLIWIAFSYSKSIGFGTFGVLNVTGEGKVVVIPDTAKFNLGVITEGEKDIVKLKDENASKINKIIDFLKEKGVKSEDIQTIGYEIYPQYTSIPCYNNKRPCPPPQISGYSINQRIAVKVKDFSKLGEILSGVVEKGANNVSNLKFEVDDVLSLKNKAKEIAIKNAKMEALKIAKEGGFKIGRLISINFSEGGSGLPIYYRTLDESSLGAGGTNPQVEAGTQEITVFVNMQYEIK
jgi:uncharacterized protein YggE